MPHPFSKISQIRLGGESGGLLKSLRAYDKSRHSLPDAVTPATTAFLWKLCAPELAAEAEALFQNARSALGYKRTDISLDLAPGQATLTTRDFCWELTYSLEPAEPARYRATRTLHHIRSGDVAQLEEFNTLFTAQFDAVIFDLVRGVSVEAVIDAVEALDPDAASPLSVDYPSDCSRCFLTVPGVAARVECDGASLAMRLPRPGSPEACLREFESLRAAFGLSQDHLLAGLLA